MSFQVCASVFLGLHVPLDVEADHFGLGIGAQGDGLAEVPGVASGTVVGHGDSARLAGQYRFLGVLGHGASAGGDGLVDDERPLAHVGEGEGAGHNRVFFGEGAEVVCGLVKLDFCLVLCKGIADAQQKKHHAQYCFFHLD